MKTLVKIIFFCSFFLFQLFSQIILPQTSDIVNLRSIVKIDEQTLVAVGTDGLITRSIDKGENWSIIQSNIPLTLNNITLLNSRKGIIVGFSGNILKTEDSGDTWTAVPSPTSQDLYEVNFADTLSGYAVGAGPTVIKTTDGGDHWFQSSITGMSNSLLLAVYFINKDTGWVAGQGGVFRTNNGGNNWLYQTGELPWIQAAYFKDKDNGIMVAGSGVIIKTTNGGNNWYQINNVTNEHLEDIKYHNGTIIVVGDHGAVLKSNDFGVNWSNLNSGTNSWLNSVAFLDDTSAIVVGNDSTIISLYSSTLTNLKEDYIEPKEYSLYQNYPNPFNPSTNIRYSLSSSGYIKILIQDILGRTLELLMDSYQREGIYNIIWDAFEYSSGIYFYSIIFISENNPKIVKETKKMILLK